MKLSEALTFDDVLIRPGYSSILPRDVSTNTYFSREIKINIPLVSAAMDTVTEAKLAIAIAQGGGIGVIHKNNSIDQQIAEIVKVKKYESGMVVDPITIRDDSSLKNLISLKEKFNISGFPVVNKNNKVVGIITNRDVRFAQNMSQPISELMTKTNLITAEEGISGKKALDILHSNKIEKLIVIDKDKRCVGLITVTDIKKSEKYPLATKDHIGRLRVAAAIGVGKDGLNRAESIFNAGADAIVLDTAHAHSKRVIDTVRDIRKIVKNNIQVIAGNIATKEAAKFISKHGNNLSSWGSFIDNSYDDLDQELVYALLKISEYPDQRVEAHRLLFEICTETSASRASKIALSDKNNQVTIWYGYLENSNDDVKNLGQEYSNQQCEQVHLY